MRKQFLDAVYEQDLMSVRLFLSNELIIDPRGRTFDEMLLYAEKNLPNLYEDCDTSFSVIYDSSKWDQQYLNEVKNELDVHFSQNLLNHYKDVVLYVLKEKADCITEQEQFGKEQDNSNVNHTVRNNIACGTLLVGGAALSVTGLYLTKYLMVKAGAVCLLTGGSCLLAGGYLVYKQFKK
ncbi:MAG: hypothetical protein IKW98_05915 [Prevotella sp.]|nr:hypothetical protein [Prevotella sp.]